MVKNLRDEMPVSAPTVASSSSGWLRTGILSPRSALLRLHPTVESAQTQPRSPDDAQVTPGANHSAIGVGGYRPRRVVDNAEICTMIDSSDEWIRTRFRDHRAPLGFR